ncbi:hypothetical protein D2E26_0179 [Bifidobacterium dolichotidis]|uniref:Uncharacterized protein n=1 Tax=Bifidobacterium dolichotidis TaxID=2306976 RepID=A0A430FRV5_9BIFI|nr:hypothetical protein [Bifidobacterium dolichotidis]RSX55616.1 hypothetical protein D2E26_0179 [Bifidobacterium dolichotidis]
MNYKLHVASAATPFTLAPGVNPNRVMDDLAGSVDGGSPAVIDIVLANGQTTSIWVNAKELAWWYVSEDTEPSN